MANSLYDTCLQGIMADLFIILDQTFLLKNTATIVPAGMSHRGNQPFICCSCFLKACSTSIAHDFKGRYHDNSTEYLVKTVLSSLEANNKVIFLSLTPRLLHSVSYFLSCSCLSVLDRKENYVVTRDADVNSILEGLDMTIFDKRSSKRWYF